MKSPYDTTQLQKIGRKRRNLVAQLAELNAALNDEIYLAAQAGVPQVDIIEWTGLARESVRLKSMSADQRDATRKARRAAK